MPPRFDIRERTLELAVADLLDGKLLRSLGFAQRGGYERLWLGQAIHSRYQEQAMAESPSYQREVPLKLTFEHRGWEITVQGRADGLRSADDGGVVVEEIKSVRRGGHLSGPAREIYQRQALLYGWMLDKLERPVAAVELVLIEIGSEQVERQTLEFDRDEVERGVRRRLNSLLHDFESRRQAAEDRRAAAERLEFPYPTPRPGQEEILQRVERALDTRAHLLIEAPTGIGKTIVALLPALRYALRHEKRVFVLTAKTLQQEMATRVLEILNRERSFHALRLRAKAKMCANSEVICHEEFCPYARDYHLKLHQSALVKRLLADFPTLLPDEIFGIAREVEVCPFEVSLELTSQAQVVVCDYNYAFEPYVSLSEFSADADLSNVILIVDEIHNLVDRGRGYYSPSLAASEVIRAAVALEAGSSPAEGAAASLCRRLARLVSRTVDDALEDLGGTVRAAEALLPEDELWALRPAFDEAFVDYLEHQRESSSYRADDAFVGLYFGYLRFVNGLHLSSRGGDEFSHCVERERDDARLRILCKDPSRFLGEVINRVHSVVGLSATLSPPEFYRDLLGFDPERTEVVSVPSPFPSENRRVVIDDTVATTYRQRAENYPRIAERLAELVSQVRGNCLALFPSYEFLRQVHTRLEIKDRQVLVQTRAGSDRERNQMLSVLRSPLSGDVLLMAVAGGVFAEGVDYPGEMLRAVVVIGPCLPALNLEQELLSRYYQERFERGFEYAFVVPGMTRVVQAAGRLIRSAEDVGVIALMDQRFLRQPYRRHLPDEWLAGEGPERLVGEPAQAALEFFSGLEGRKNGPAGRRG